MKISQAGAQLTSTDIAEFETAMDVSLPDEYRLFLLQNNGGVPEPSWFRRDDGSHEDISHFFGIDPENPAADAERYASYREWIPARFFPIALCGSGDIVCISLSGGDRGSIYYWNHDIGWQNDEPTEKSLLKLTDSLTSFLGTVDKFDDDLHSSTIVVHKPWWKFW